MPDASLAVIRISNEGGLDQGSINRAARSFVNPKSYFLMQEKRAKPGPSRLYNVTGIAGTAVRR